ncbi:MAG: hypothetical protein ACRELD_10160 [Longimicrobiales bacterium]
MRKPILAAAALLVAGCATTAEMVPVTESISSRRAELTERNDSDLRGAAAANTGWGQTGASITIAGADSGGQHPWHVHTGSCDSGGGIVGPATAYPVLSVGANGQASASATVALELTPGASYHVNVHRSPTDLGTIIACGDLR